MGGHKNAFAAKAAIFVRDAFYACICAGPRCQVHLGHTVKNNRFLCCIRGHSCHVTVPGPVACIPPVHHCFIHPPKVVQGIVWRGIKCRQGHIVRRSTAESNLPNQAYRSRATTSPRLRTLLCHSIPHLPIFTFAHFPIGNCREELQQMHIPVAF